LYFRLPHRDGKFDKIANAEFMHLRHLTKLERLEIFGGRLGDDALAGLQNLTELREVNVHNGNFTDNALRHFSKLSKLERLRIVVPDSKITGTGLVHLKGLRGLRSLAISGRMAAQALREMPVFPAIEELHLYCGEGEPDLPQLAQMPRLANVGIRPVTDQLIKQLAGLPQIESIECGQMVTDAGAKALAGIPNLKAIVLEESHVTDVGIADICRIERLEVLGLSRDSTDKCVEHVLKLKTLRNLYIGRTAITDEGFVRFAGLKELKQIVMRGGQFSPAAINRFRAASPNCKVSAY
jgi:hypothetical protein